MYSWWLPRVGRTSSDARKLARTEQRLHAFDPPTILLFLSFLSFFPLLPKIHVSLFREKENPLSNNLRTIFYDSFRNFFLRKFQSFLFRGIKKSRIRIKNRFSRRNVVGKIGRAIGWAYDVSGGRGARRMGTEDGKWKMMAVETDWARARARS